MYIYKLGHSEQFGIKEFEFLTKKKALWSNQNWLISKNLLDTSVCGSLIFGGQIENSKSILENEFDTFADYSFVKLKKKNSQNSQELQEFEELKNQNLDQKKEILENTEAEDLTKKSKKLQNTNNSLQNWNQENQSLGQDLEVDLEDSLEDLDGIENKNTFRLLANFLSKNPYKKIGIALLVKSDQQKVMNLAKKLDCKKINIISCLPNYGHWKSCKKWIVIMQNPIKKITQNDQFENPKIKNQTDNQVDKNEDNSIENSLIELQNLQLQKLILFEIKSFCDQEYWANLDQNLSGEMSRGLMNLKLARTLVNLTDKTVILDPFCGSGRTMAAGFDLDKRFILSDVDKICKNEVESNLEFLKNQKNGKLWQKNQNLDGGLKALSENSQEKVKQQNNQEIEKTNKFENSENKTENFDKIEQKALKKNCKLLANLTLDATEISKLLDDKELENLDFGQIAIVTEGFLGTNFKQIPTQKQIDSEFENLEKLWTKTLAQSSKIGIKEIIFCLPFYNTKPSKSDEENSQSFIKSGNKKKKFEENLTLPNPKIKSQNILDKKLQGKFDKLKTKMSENEVDSKLSFENIVRKKKGSQNKDGNGKLIGKLIVSNLAAKINNYQSKSQTWTPKNIENERLAKSRFSNFGEKNQNNQGYNKASNEQKKTKVGQSFDKKSDFESKSSKYEKKNFGKSQNKRGAQDYKFGKNDIDKEGTRTFGNINKSGKPTSYKIKPKFGKIERDNEKNIEKKAFRTKHKSGFEDKNKLNFNNSKPTSNYSNFSKSQTWENSEKNYKNRWENATKTENLKDRESSSKNIKTSKNNFGKNPIENDPKFSTKFSKFTRTFDKRNQNKEKPDLTKDYSEEYSNFAKSNYSKGKSFEKNQSKSSFRDQNLNKKLKNNPRNSNYFDKFKMKNPNLENKINSKITSKSFEQKENQSEIQNKFILPPFLEKLIEASDYDFAWKDKYLLYNRSSSFVGHLVIKIQLKE